MTIGGFAITEERERDFDMTYPFSASEQTLLYKRPDSDYDWSSFVKPFPTQVSFFRFKGMFWLFKISDT